MRLLTTRRFLPLFITQFLGAFNDNLFKNALVMLLTFKLAEHTAIKPEILIIAAGGLFIFPYFLFSATAGQLADKIDKARLARITKLSAPSNMRCCHNICMRMNWCWAMR